MLPATRFLITVVRFPNNFSFHRRFLIFKHFFRSFVVISFSSFASVMLHCFPTFSRSLVDVLTILISHLAFMLSTSSRGNISVCPRHLNYSLRFQAIIPFLYYINKEVIYFSTYQPQSKVTYCNQSAFSFLSLLVSGISLISDNNF